MCMRRYSETRVSLAEHVCDWLSCQSTWSNINWLSCQSTWSNINWLSCQGQTSDQHSQELPELPPRFTPPPVSLAEHDALALVPTQEHASQTDEPLLSALAPGAVMSVGLPPRIISTKDVIVTATVCTSAGLVMFVWRGGMVGHASYDTFYQAIIGLNARCFAVGGCCFPFVSLSSTNCFLNFTSKRPHSFTYNVPTI